MERSRCCCGLKFSSAVRCLAIYGLVISVLGMIALPLILRIKQSVIIDGIFGTATILLFWWFFFSYLLYKTNKNNEVGDLKNLIKIGCYAIGLVEILFMVVGFFIGICIFDLWHNPLYSLPILFEGIWLIPQSLFIHGLRTSNPSMIEPWIIFNCVLFPFISFLGLGGCILFGPIWWTIPQLFIVFAFLENFSNEHLRRIDMDVDMTDLPPPYSDIDLYPSTA